MSKKQEYLAKKRKRAIEIAMSGKVDKKLGKYVPVIILPLSEHAKTTDIHVGINAYGVTFKSREPIALPEKVVQYLEEECYEFVYIPNEVEGKNPTPEKSFHYVAKEIKPTEEELQEAQEALAEKE